MVLNQCARPSFALIIILLCVFTVNFAKEPRVQDNNDELLFEDPSYIKLLQEAAHDGDDGAAHCNANGTGTLTDAEILADEIEAKSDVPVGEPPRPRDPEDDTAHYITRYLKAGRIKEARARAKVVNFTHVLSYSGYLTVDEGYNSNLFFWFFPAAFDPDNAPLILWLQGGPGVSAFYGIFQENGPFYFDEQDRIKFRQTPWTLTHSVLYIDSPVGTGFSFTEDERGYSRFVEDTSVNLYNGLLQFFQIFSEFSHQPFYITGQSYAGKFGPSLGSKIHHENSYNLNLKINLKGLALGSGFFDAVMQSDYGQYFYHLGLIDKSDIQIFDEQHKRLQQYVEHKYWVEAQEILQELILGWPLPITTLFQNMTGFVYKSNFLYSSLPDKVKYGSRFLRQNPYIRQLLHVGDQRFGNSTKVFNYMIEDIAQSVKPQVEELLEANYRFLFYAGQMDLMVPHIGIENFIQNLTWVGSDGFRNAKRKIWAINNDIAGFAKNYKNLQYVLVRNAGHSAPHDQPEWCFEMINKFTRELTF